MIGKSEDFGTAVLERMTSMRLCDLDEIKVCVDRQYKNCHGYSGNKKAIYREAILAVKSILHSAKPIDAVPVLRCRDCKYWGDGDGKLQGSDGALFARCKVHNCLVDGRHTGWCPTENDFCCIYLHSCEGQCAKGGADNG